MKKGKEKRRCAFCGKSFVPNKPFQIYDKTTCNQQAYAERQKEKVRRAEEILKSVREAAS